MVINWTVPAVRDLKDFREYSQISNVTDYIIKLVENVNLLSEQPKLGKIFIYTNQHIVRQLIHAKHRVLYYVDNDVIHIIAIIHHKQDSKKKVEYIKQFFEDK